MKRRLRIVWHRFRFRPDPRKRDRWAGIVESERLIAAMEGLASLHRLQMTIAAIGPMYEYVRAAAEYREHKRAQQLYLDARTHMGISDEEARMAARKAAERAAYRRVYGE